MTLTPTLHPIRDPLPLRRNEALRLGDAHGLSLASAGGTLWVTIDGDLHDYVLEPGESLRIESHAPTVVMALHAPALLTVRH